MKTVVSIALFFSTTLLVAQDRYFYLTLDVSKPLANTSWVNDASARGVRLGFRSFITDKISAGLDLGMNSFDEYFPRQTVETSTGAITTDYFHYIYSFSAAISGQYNFTVGDGEKFIPYAGIGLGATNQEYVKYYNFYSENDKSWGFLVRPEAGIHVRLSERRGLGVMAAIHYDYATNRMKNLDYKGFSALGFQVGLVFMDR
jgi:outer membrane protein W